MKSLLLKISIDQLVHIVTRYYGNIGFPFSQVKHCFVLYFNLFSAHMVIIGQNISQVSSWIAKTHTQNHTPSYARSVYVCMQVSMYTIIPISSVIHTLQLMKHFLKGFGFSSSLSAMQLYCMLKMLYIIINQCEHT